MLLLNSLFGICLLKSFINCDYQSSFTTSISSSLSVTEKYWDNDDSFYPSLKWSDDFDWKILSVLNPKTVNILYSPASLKIILALLYEASSGVTKKDFEDTFTFFNKNNIRENIKEILDSFHVNTSSENKLNLSTRIFVDSEITIKKNYAEKIADNYNVKITSVNFTNLHETTDKINNWVNKETHGSIANFITDTEDFQDMIMLLANAIFYKGVWKYQFPKNDTIVQGFTASPFTTIYVPYMTTTNNFYYFESQELETKILRLPYKNSRFSMILLLPFASGGLRSLIGKITLSVLHQQLHYLYKRTVLVSIPKFNFKLKASFTDILKECGIKKMFQNSASFTGIVEGNSTILRKLVVSDILQTTGIDIDEEGSVVYGVTSVVIGNKIGVPDNIFNASHPFLFFIQDDISGTILFLGKVENPLYQELKIQKQDETNI